LLHGHRWWSRPEFWKVLREGSFKGYRAEVVRLEGRRNSLPKSSKLVRSATYSSRRLLKDQFKHEPSEGRQARTSPLERHRTLLVALLEFQDAVLHGRGYSPRRGRGLKLPRRFEVVPASRFGDQCPCAADVTARGATNRSRAAPPGACGARLVGSGDSLSIASRGETCAVYTQERHGCLSIL
jgi:hypothetical protein